MTTSTNRAAPGRARKPASGQPVMKRSYKPIPSTRYIVAGSMALLLGMTLIIGAMSYVNTFDDRPVVALTTLDDPFNWAVPGYQPGGLNNKVGTPPKAQGESAGPVGSPKSATYAAPANGFSSSSALSFFRGATVPRPAPAPDRPPLVILAAQGLRWDQSRLDLFPEVFSDEPQGSIANLVVRAQGKTTCAVDAFLTLGAATRIGDENGCLPWDLPGAPAAAPLGALDTHRWQGASWGKVRAKARQHGALDRLGHLGQQLQKAHKQVLIVGQRPGAMVANQNGQVLAQYLPTQDFLQADLQVSSATISAAIAGKDLAVVDLEPLASAISQRSVLTSVSGQTLPAASDVKQLAVARALLEQLTDRGANVLLVSLADTLPQPRLQLFSAWGPDFASGWAYSNTVRRAGLVQLTDLGATVNSLLGLPALGWVGPISTVNQSLPEEPLTLVQNQARRAAGVLWAQGPFIGALSLCLLLALPAATWSLHRQTHRRYAPPTAGATWEKPRALLKFWRALGTWLALLVPATFAAGLTRWWTFAPSPTEENLNVLAAHAIIAPVAIATVLSLFFLLTPGVRQLNPFLSIMVFTLIIAILDPFFGSWMMIDSLLGTQSLVGGRFFGMDNLLYALLVTAALALATFLATRMDRIGQHKLGLIIASILGIVVVLIDGLPGVGADFGGPIPLLAGFVVLLAFLTPLRHPWLALLGSLLAGGVLVSLLAFLDWLRPAGARTHLGNFVDSLVAGKLPFIIWQKSTQLWRAGWPPWALALAATITVAVAVVTLWPVIKDAVNPYTLGYGWLSGKPEKHTHPPLLRLSAPWQAFGKAWLVTIVLAVLTNDSSVLIGLIALALLGPATIGAVTHRYLRPTEPSPNPGFSVPGGP